MYKKYPWIRTTKRHRLKVNATSELTLLVELYLKYGPGASQVYH